MLGENLCVSTKVIRVNLEAEELVVGGSLARSCDLEDLCAVKYGDKYLDVLLKFKTGS